MLTTTNQTVSAAPIDVFHQFLNWFTQKPTSTPPQAQPKWLRDARDEDLLKVGLTREALMLDALVQRRAF